MAVEKMSISMDESLGAEIRAAAKDAGMPVSAWVADAVAARLRNVALGELLGEYQAEHGAFTEAEIREAEIELGYRTPGDGAA